MNVSSTTLSRASVVLGVLSLASALWAVVELARSQNPVPLLLAVCLVALAAITSMWARRQQEQEDD